MEQLMRQLALQRITLWHPLLGVGLYFCVNCLLVALRLDWSRSPRFRRVVLGHNLLLASYSACTFGTALYLLTFQDAFDRNGKAVFSSPGFAGLAHLFYLSKYYEFFDTWIHYMKGRSPGFLQLYHHVGAVGTMAMCVKYKVEAVVYFLVLNSAVHTIMYTYYAGATVGLRFPFKSLITTLQMMQFVAGLGASLWTFAFQSMSTAQAAVLGITDLYVLVLLGLFQRFYAAAYRAHDKIAHDKIKQK